MRSPAGDRSPLQGKQFLGSQPQTSMPKPTEGLKPATKTLEALFPEAPTRAFSLLALLFKPWNLLALVVALARNDLCLPDEYVIDAQVLNNPGPIPHNSFSDLLIPVASLGKEATTAAFFQQPQNSPGSIQSGP